MRKTLLTAICLVFCTAMSAQDLALIYSMIPNDPVSVATAGSASASSDRTAMSAFGNAAAMAFNEDKGQIQASYNSWAPNGQFSNRISLGGAVRLGKVFSLSAAGVYGTGQEYDEIDADGIPLGKLKTSDLMFGASLGITATPHLGIGLGCRYARENLFEDKAISSAMADLSVMYHNKGLNVTAGARSLGPVVRDQAGRKFYLPYAANLAAYYSLTFAEDHRIGFGADGNYFFNGGIEAAAGFQYSWQDTVFARAGYHYGSSYAPIPQYLGLGLGVKFFGICIDCAYMTLNETIGNTLALSLGYCF